MPVRIYEISKKLGLENKEVLAKAKDLGIAAARVASSSLDKITAEYLEDQLRLAHPELANPPSAPELVSPGPVASAPAFETSAAAVAVIAERVASPAPAEHPVVAPEASTVMEPAALTEAP